MGTANSASLLGTLRDGTREAHARLDGRLGIESAALTNDERGLARYAAFLRGSASAVVPLERALEAWLPPSDGVRRRDALGADLAALGHALPDAAAMPELSSRADAYGAAYVMEGSALGGAVLARRVGEALGAEAPRSYLSLRGDRTGPHWRSFTEALDAWGSDATDAERERALATARATFEAYERAFEASGAIR